MTILIVDDSPETRDALRAWLAKTGYRDTLTASSAQEAFAILGLEGEPTAAPRVDAILMDVAMPDLDGIAACRRIKSHPPLHDVPVIMVTGHAEESDLTQAFAAGAMDYVTKPVKLQELLARLRSALAIKQELDERKSRQRELAALTCQLREANLRLEELSTLDPLTGISNRRSFDATLAREFARAVRAAAPLSAVMIDVDHFKAYNDHYGHPAGDECLRKVAATLDGHVKRSGDFLARYGGEEFVALLTNTSRAGACALAEECRAAVYAMRLEHVRSPYRQVTLSLGVAALVRNGAGQADALVHAADQALYLAKQTGRNRVVVYDERGNAA